MEKQKTELPEITLVGLSLRTNNKDEMNPDTSKISKLAEKYWMQQTADGIQHRAKPGITYSVYTDYESDEHGEYTYFLGEAVDSLDGQDLDTFQTITLPASHYTKFTTEQGALPDIIISAWKKIWDMSPKQIGGERTYKADFDMFDEKARDPSNAVVDIYVGIKD